MSAYQQKITRHTKRQRTQLEETEKASEPQIGMSVGIIKPGICLKQLPVSHHKWNNPSGIKLNGTINQLDIINITGPSHSTTAKNIHFVKLTWNTHLDHIMDHISIFNKCRRMEIMLCHSALMELNWQNNKNGSAKSQNICRLNI